jgi:hypothetical protein
LEITAGILSESGANLLGSSITIIPLAAGPGLAYAEPAIIGETSCQAETLSALRIVWQGGVMALDGSELGNNELDQFFVETSAGTVFPVAFSDLNDRDNNLELCLTIYDIDHINMSQFVDT